MKSNYPLSSMELNDILFSAYEDLVYLLGYNNSNNITISGKYDQLDDDVTNTFLSGVLALNDLYEDNVEFDPFSGYMDISDHLKIDYIYRKHFQSENYNG